MLRSFLLLTFRNLFRKNRLFTLINISGLAVGFGAAMLIAVFIYDEYSFDAYHSKADRIYRIVLDFTEKGNVVSWAKTSAPIGKHLKGSYPEVGNVVRIRKNPGTDLLSYEDVKLYEERIYFADSTLFNVFDFRLLRGNPVTALRNGNSIVVTAALAEKYFGTADVIGKTIRFNNVVDLEITGILEDIPANSHFVADAFISFSTLDGLFGEKRLAHWGWMDHYTYVLISPGTDPKTLEDKFPEFIRSNAPEWVSEKEKLYLQPLTSIHLHSHRKDELAPNSNEMYSVVLGTIAVFILLMACANFINLSTATLTSRLKEISIQKIMGAGRTHLIAFFWAEAVMICMISLVLAYIVVALVTPHFNEITGKYISFRDHHWIILPSLLLTIVVGLIGGIAPTLQAQKADLRTFRIPNSGLSSIAFLRTVAITFQFSTSILLITATWIVSQQFYFLKSARIGFSSEKVMVIPVKDRMQNEKHNVITDELAKLPGVESATFSSSSPGLGNPYTHTYTFAGSEMGEQVLAAFFVDRNFYDLFGLQLKEGRFPSMDARDSLVEVVINESAVNHVNLTDPVGQYLTGQVAGKVVGVIADFNHGTLHSAIGPLIMYSYPQNFRFVSLRLGEHFDIGQIDKKWQEFYPGYPLEYFFLDERIQQLYGAEYQLSRAYTVFSVIAIAIAGFGLVGLTTYVLNRKLKELSIRKVLGSSTSQLLAWIYSGYLKVAVIATVIAWITAFFWMEDWLNRFAFKTQITVSHFAVPALVTIGVLLLSTGFQTVRASRTNPMKYLRDE